MRWAIAVLACLPCVAQADAVIATHVLRATSVIGEGDVALVEADIPGAPSSLGAVIGQEVRQTIYAGRPVLSEHIGPPTMVERNQLVTLVYQQGPLAIVTEGRALARGGLGEVVRVMNTVSHTTVLGIIDADGTVRVSPTQE